MPTVGVRELKNNATRIVRSVREDGAAYIVTVSGKPAAVLRPFTHGDALAVRQSQADALLDLLDELTDEITDAWASPLSAAEAVAEQRR